MKQRLRRILWRIQDQQPYDVYSWIDFVACIASYALVALLAWFALILAGLTEMPL